MDWGVELAKLGPFLVLVLLQIGLIVFLIVRNNSKDLRDNTHAVIQLQVEMKNCIEKLSGIPELRRDVDGLGSALREMRAQLSNRGNGSDS